jgi:hypothetical protein
MEQSNAFVKAFPITWIVTLFLTVVLWIVVDKMWAISFVLGSVTTLMMMSMLYKTTRRVLTEKNPNAKKIVVWNYVLRYIFYAIILIVAAMSVHLEVLGTAIGLFTFKISLYISLLIEKKGRKK